MSLNLLRMINEHCDDIPHSIHWRYKAQYTVQDVQLTCIGLRGRYQRCLWYCYACDLYWQCCCWYCRWWHFFYQAVGHLIASYTRTFGFIASHIVCIKWFRIISWSCESLFKRISVLVVLSTLWGVLNIFLDFLLRKKIQWICGSPLFWNLMTFIHAPVFLNTFSLFTIWSRAGSISWKTLTHIYSRSGAVCMRRSVSVSSIHFGLQIMFKKMYGWLLLLEMAILSNICALVYPSAPMMVADRTNSLTALHSSHSSTVAVPSKYSIRPV